ncbi:MAG: hypothetical protein OER90_18580 [Gemmatimonadota bacterium]|nr:hypothetical protein [Gemmatimonadota bacterium]
MPKTWLALGAFTPLIALTGACGAPSGAPALSAAPLSVCWTLQRTIDGAAVTADTGFVPSQFAFSVSPAGAISIPGTSVSGRWTVVSTDSVHAEWGEGRRRVWLFGSVQEDQFTGSGHVFTRVGASVLVTYAGVRVRCDPGT